MFRSHTVGQSQFPTTDWIEMNVLLREAESLLKSSEVTTQQEKAAKQKAKLIDSDKVETTANPAVRTKDAPATKVPESVTE